MKLTIKQLKKLIRESWRYAQGSVGEIYRNVRTGDVVRIIEVWEYPAEPGERHEIVYYQVQFPDGNIRDIKARRFHSSYEQTTLSEHTDNVIAFPTVSAKKNRLNALRDQWISLYSEDDPSMANEGINSWVEQVDNAVHAIDVMIGDDLELFDFAAEDVYEKLIDGRYHPGNMWFEGQLYGDDGEDY
jgi:hypothetical protein